MRYYKNNLPKVDDIVFVKFNRITDQYTVIVNLVEYDNKEAMILATEIHNKKVNIEKVFNNRILPCLVLSIDEEKSYIDLSLKRVMKEDSLKYKEIYPYLEKIVDLIEEINELYKLYKEKYVPEGEKINVYQDTIWEIFENNPGNEKLDELYESLIKNPKYLFQYSKNLPQDFINKCIENYNLRTKATDMTVMNDFSLTVLDKNAVNILKSVLLDDIPKTILEFMKIDCVSSPKYRLTITAKDENQIKLLIDDFSNLIKEKIKNINAFFKMDENYIVINKKSYSLAPFKSFIKYF